MKRTEKPKTKRFVVKAHPMRLRPGIDPTGFNKLIDDLEIEAFLETSRKLDAYIAAKKHKK